MNLNKAVALRISELCREKNITLYRLAMNSGITHSTLKNIIHETVARHPEKKLIIFNFY